VDGAGPLVHRERRVCKAARRFGCSLAFGSESMLDMVARSAAFDMGILLVIVFRTSSICCSCGVVELAGGGTTCDDGVRADDRSGSVALRARGVVEKGELVAWDGALFNRERWASTNASREPRSSLSEPSTTMGL